MPTIPESMRANITADIERKKFSVPYNSRTYTVACYNLYARNTSHQLRRLELPMDLTVNSLLLQMGAIMFVTRILTLALKPLHQPRIISHILGGILLGPTCLGRILNMFNMFTAFAPFQSLLSLETIGNLGLVYYIFLVGLELELKPVIRAGRKALSIALAGMVVAIGSGWALHFLLVKKSLNLKVVISTNDHNNTHSGPLFWAVALATTSFPDVARILADLKLLHSEIGRLALSAAVISELCSWFLFILLLAVINRSGHYLWTGLSTLAFVGFCVCVLRPALPKLIRLATKNKQDKKDGYNEIHVSFVLLGVLASAMITDALGTLSYVGPFVLGAIMPRGELRKLVVDKIQPFVSAILMPLLFLIVGLRTNAWFILSEKDSFNSSIIFPGRFIGVIALAFLAKIAGSFVAALINKMTPRDALVLGVIMNTKGVLALIILSAGKDLKTLDNQTFAAMTLLVWAITIPVGPLLAFTYKTTKRFAQYTNRNIRSIGPDTQLRILACTYDSHNSSGIINLLEASNPTRQSPIYIFAVQLVELIGHTSAMLIVNDACKSNNERSNHGGGPISSTRYSNSNPFEFYGKQRENVYVQALTVVSAYATMHEDICNLAEDESITLVIVPFHKQSTIDGAMEESDPALRVVNRNVIDNAKCSVGVFVDRGLGISQIFNSNIGSHTSSDGVSYHHFAVFFIGGADDREALAYAKRMAGHPRVDLTVIRFILSPEACLDDAEKSNEILEAMANTGRQKQLDDLFVDGFKVHTMDNSSIELVEEVVNSWEETLDVIKSIEGECDLYIMGRRHGSSSTSTMTSVLDSDSDELGTLADALVSSSFFMVNTSILIVQQGAVVDDRQDASDDQEM